jgi:PIN domain nuclease of toxin-antitoxin system
MREDFDAPLPPHVLAGFHALEVERLPHHHTDPFDRLLIAQAMAQGSTMVTGDRQFGRYDVPVIWC